MYALAIALLASGLVSADRFPPTAREQLAQAKTCTALAQKTANDQAPALRKLNQLPPALLEHAVLRSVGGCLVREVEWRGRTVLIAPQPMPAIARLTPDAR